MQTASDSDPRARARRPDLHRRGRHPAVGAAGARSRRTGSGSRSIRPATRRSPSACSTTCPGRCSHRFGTMRDLVIGVTVVLPDGHARELGRQGREERRGLRPRRSSSAARAGGSARSSGSRCGCIPLPAAARTVVIDARTGARCTARSSCRARSTSRTAACTSSSRARRARSTRRLQALGGEESEPWEELRALQARLPGRVALGRRGRRRSCVPARASPTSSRRASRRGARSPSASWRRCAARADRRLRPLRLLPADVPDVLAVARGDGLAARADLPDAGARRRVDRADATRSSSTSTAASAAWRASRRARRACSTTG